MRLIVMMFIPDLLKSHKSATDDTKVFVHDDLVEWMLANLNQPISLTELELRSNFSRRSLQYAFKQRCARPVVSQWICAVFGSQGSRRDRSSPTHEGFSA
jgi:hypothetical protein